ncbi:hypothetical protein [Rhodoplanes sp. SY1]
MSRLEAYWNRSSTTGRSALCHALLHTWRDSPGWQRRLRDDFGIVWC